MDHRNARRSFADGGGHAFQTAATHVADGEDARQAGFEEMRLASERPARGLELVGTQAPARTDEPFVVEREATL